MICASSCKREAQTFGLGEASLWTTGSKPPFFHTIRQFFYCWHTSLLHLSFFLSIGVQNRSLPIFDTYLFVVGSVTCHSTHREGREKHMGINSLFPLCGFWGSKMGPQL